MTGADHCVNFAVPKQSILGKCIERAVSVPLIKRLSVWKCLPLQ